MSAVAHYFPFGPVADIIAHRGWEPCEAITALGCSAAALGKWRRNGRIPLDSADRVAIRLGYHPANIWPDWWWAA